MNARFRTPLKRALGLGSAHRGVHHFMAQRITALALIALVIWFVWIALRMVALDYAAAHALVAQPLNALLMITFVIAMFWHAQLGMQVVIEDYVHAPGTQMLLQVAVKFLTFIGAAACVLAVIRIVMQG